ncbi:hypothetical protein SK128_024659, partial [Halocaridina rubra]
SSREVVIGSAVCKRHHHVTHVMEHERSESFEREADFLPEFRTKEPITKSNTEALSEESNSSYVKSEAENGNEKSSCMDVETLFSCKEYLKGHAFLHGGERPHECDICKKTFLHKASLRKHKLIHLREKTLVCNVCNESFTEKLDWSTHVKTHREAGYCICCICHKLYDDQKLFISLDFPFGNNENSYACKSCHEVHFGDQSGSSAEGNPYTVYLIEDIQVKEEKDNQTEEEGQDLLSFDIQTEEEEQDLISDSQREEEEQALLSDNNPTEEQDILSKNNQTKKEEQDLLSDNNQREEEEQDLLSNNCQT